MSDDQVSLGGYGLGYGLWLRYKGRQIVIVLLILLLVGGLAVLGYQELQAAKQQHLGMSQEHEGILSELRVISWILSLPPEDRPRLLPPESAWRRLGARTYEDLERERAIRRKQQPGATD